MLKIDGDKVRQFREQKGLTQLYVSTVVEVTTDTISRWENRRYQTIKKENAIKLAQALEVELDDILDSDQDESSVKDQTYPNKGFSKQLGIGIICLLALFFLLLGFSLWRTKALNDYSLDSERILPAHVPPGVAFPVLVTVLTDASDPFSIIVKENLPAQSSSHQGVPEHIAQSQNHTVLRWISKVDSNGTHFAYMAVTEPGATLGEELHFNGVITSRSREKLVHEISGDMKVLLKPYHWTDDNRDNIIDDDEILNVYDTYGAIEGFDFGKKLIEEIWSGQGYTWNPQTKKFDIIP